MFRGRRPRNIEGFGAPRLVQCLKTLLIRTDVESVSGLPVPALSPS